MIEWRIQFTSGFRVMQLKNKLHHIQMKMILLHKSSKIKSKVNVIATVGSPIDPKDLIFYTHNGLPPILWPFKTAIRRNLQPLNLDDCYSTKQRTHFVHLTHRAMYATNTNSYNIKDQMYHHTLLKAHLIKEGDKLSDNQRLIIE